MDINDKRLRKAELENEAAEVRREIERQKNQMKIAMMTITGLESYLKELDEAHKKLGGWGDAA